MRHDERLGQGNGEVIARGAVRTAGRAVRVVGLGLVVLLLGARALAALPADDERLCPGGQPAEADLGIAGLACNCSVRHEPAAGPDRWRFRTEPEIRSVRAGGPAEGVLRPGDRVVAIDGLLITTPEGGARWSEVRPGERVTLRVRRASPSEVAETIDTVELVVGSRCPEAPAPPAAPAEEETGGPALPDLSELGDRMGAMGGMRKILPRGWLGLGLSCHCTVQAGDEAPSWTFYELPTVGAVDEAGPAAGAGVLPGDLLVAVDGRTLTDAAGAAAFSSVRPGQRVRLTVRRDGTDRQVELIAGERPE